MLLINPIAGRDEKISKPVYKGADEREDTEGGPFAAFIVGSELKPLLPAATGIVTPSSPRQLVRVFHRRVSFHLVHRFLDLENISIVG